MNLSIEDVQTILRPVIPTAAEMLADRFQEVTGREMSDGAFDALGDRLMDGAADGLVAAAGKMS